VNGDGFADLVVGAYLGDPGGRTDVGSASVFHGSASGVATVPARVLEGGAQFDGFGRSVASAGDVNGDGFSDLVVGAYAAAPGGRTDAGSASVFHGSASGVTTAPVRVLEGVAGRDFFGRSVASAGDVNGDGLGDLVVGAGGADPGGRMEAGSASVFHGNATGIATTPARVLDGAAAGDSFGLSVASAVEDRDRAPTHPAYDHRIFDSLGEPVTNTIVASTCTRSEHAAFATASTLQRLPAVARPNVHRWCTLLRTS
jgi:hypothetical protein